MNSIDAIEVYKHFYKLDEKELNEIVSHFGKMDFGVLKNDEETKSWIDKFGKLAGNGSKQIVIDFDEDYEFVLVRAVPKKYGASKDAPDN